MSVLLISQRTMSNIWSLLIKSCLNNWNNYFNWEKRFFSVFSGSDPFSWHYQITITFHPNAFSWFSASLSRFWVPEILSIHHSVRVLGITKYRQPSCPCQKQPLINSTVLYLGKTISGFPGRVFTFSLYLKLLANKNCRTSISGFVFFPFMRLMLKERVVVLCTSAKIVSSLKFRV